MLGISMRTNLVTIILVIDNKIKNLILQTTFFFYDSAKICLAFTQIFWQIAQNREDGRFLDHQIFIKGFWYLTITLSKHSFDAFYFKSDSFVCKCTIWVDESKKIPISSSVTTKYLFIRSKNYVNLKLMNFWGDHGKNADCRKYE